MSVSAIDFGMLFAVMTFGWGLSLVLYREVAVGLNWPMGQLQRERPKWARLVGYTCLAVACLFALWRGLAGYPISAAMILVFGMCWTAFWIGFLRVGAQSALLFGPMGAGVLILRWLI